MLFSSSYTKSLEKHKFLASNPNLPINSIEELEPKNDERVVYSKGLKSYIVADILDEDIVCPYGNDEYEYKYVLADDFTCITYGEILGTVSPEIIEKMPKSN